MRISLADNVFSLSSSSARVAAALETLYSAFSSPPGPAATWTIHFSERQTFSADDTLPPVLTASFAGARVDVRYGAAFHGQIDRAAGHAEFQLGAWPEFLPTGSLQNALRVCLVLRLAPQEGLLIHAASFAAEGRAFAFFGPSGAGKSTLSRHFPSASLLSDEIACVTQNEHPEAHRAPFTGERLPPAVPLSGRLSALILLQKNAGPIPTLERTRTAAAFRALLGCVLHVGHDPVLTRALFLAAEKLIQRVPLLTLSTPLLTADSGPETLRRVLAEAHL